MRFSTSRIFFLSGSLTTFNLLSVSFCFADLLARAVGNRYSLKTYEVDRNVNIRLVIFYLNPDHLFFILCY